MATTYTASAAKTFTRLDLLKTQIRVALLRTTDISSSFLDKMMQGIDKHWIAAVKVWALDETNLCRAQFSMKIDWEEHDGKMAIGRATITIDERWLADTAIEVQETIQLFDHFVRAHNLRRKWTVTYVSSVNREEIDKILGFKSAPRVKWAAGESEALNFQIPELSELRVGCRIVMD